MDDTQNPIPDQQNINEAPDISPVDIQTLSLQERVSRIENSLSIN